MLHLPKCFTFFTHTYQKINSIKIPQALFHIGLTEFSIYLHKKLISEKRYSPLFSSGNISLHGVPCLICTVKSLFAKKQKDIPRFFFGEYLAARRSVLAGVQGFEPRKCLSQSQVPYRLATPQNTVRVNKAANL